MLGTLELVCSSCLSRPRPRSPGTGSQHRLPYRQGSAGARRLSGLLLVCPVMWWLGGVITLGQGCPQHCNCLEQDVGSGLETLRKAKEAAQGSSSIQAPGPLNLSAFAVGVSV